MGEGSPQHWVGGVLGGEPVGIPAKTETGDSSELDRELQKDCRAAVVCAWAIPWEGRKVWVHLAPGTKESTECVRGSLQDLQRRGWSDPDGVLREGAAGLIWALQACFPSVRRQRCLAPKMRNLMRKWTESIAAEFQAAAAAV